jgi:phosphate:Na+ symporter
MIAEAVTPVEAGPVLMGLLGGLAVFLFGLGLMTDAVKAVAGGSMRVLLARLTKNRFTAAFSGAFVTAVIQSSTVTTVLMVGFISAGLMSLEQSIGVIMGANVGSTVTAQVIAFKITDYALALVAAGFAVRFLTKRERPVLYGTAVLGLGFLFLGMHLMSEATEPLRTYEPFIEWMRRMENPALAVLAATIFTALVHSSAATTSIVIVLASQGLISLEAGIALALGANIGTCATALLAAIGKPREAVRAAVAHVTFNVLGVLLWVWLIGFLASVVRSIGGDVPRQIANAHTLFNVANVLLFLPFTGVLAVLIRRLVPEREGAERDPGKPLYLDEAVIAAPELALVNARIEIGRLGELASAMLDRLLPVVLEGEQPDLDRLSRRGDSVERLYQSIMDYLGKVSRAGLTRAQTHRLTTCTAIANHIQNVALTVESNFLDIATERLEKGVRASEATKAQLLPLSDLVRGAFFTAMDALEREDADRANRVAELGPAVDRLSADAKRHLLARLSAPEPNRTWTFRLESDIVENLKRLYYFSKRISLAVVGICDAGQGGKPAK